MQSWGLVRSLFSFKPDDGIQSHTMGKEYREE